MNYINELDDKIYQALMKLESHIATETMIIISMFASAITLIALSIIFLIGIKNKKYPKYIILNLILAFISNKVLQFIIRRKRPERLQIVPETGFGFPSGHVMIGFAYYVFLIYLIYKNIENKKIKYPLIVFLAILILLIGISRIYLGVHYVTDVLGGLIFGCIYIILFIKYVYKNKKIKIVK